MGLALALAVARPGNRDVLRARDVMRDEGRAAREERAAG